MSVPVKHHYLPRWYLERWSRGGTVVRYVRPLGANGPLDCKRKAPKAIAYEPYLYHLPDIDDAIESQAIEMRLLQRVDDLAAKAIAKLERGERGSLEDPISLSQFMISLIHRSPSRLKALRDEMAVKADGTLIGDPNEPGYSETLKSMTNRLLASLIESTYGVEILTKFKVFNIKIERAKLRLVTSDRPISASSMIVSQDGFMVLPYAPDRLLILAHNEQIAKAFATQNPNVLVAGINAAVVEQASDIVIASDEKATAMIDRLFLRPTPDAQFDGSGMIRRKSPYVDLSPKTRSFSRFRKNAMRYLEGG